MNQTELAEQIAQIVIDELSSQTDLRYFIVQILSLVVRCGVGGLSLWKMKRNAIMNEGNKQHITEIFQKLGAKFGELVGIKVPDELKSSEAPVDLEKNVQS